MSPVILSLFLAQFSNVVDFMMIMPLGPIFMREFQLDPSHFGLLVSIYTFACAAAGILAFSILDKFDRRRLFLGTFFLFLISNLVCAAAQGYHTLLVGRLVSGLSGGLLEAATFTLVGDLFPASRRGEVTGKIISAFSLSSLAGVPLGLLIAAHSSWRYVFVFVAFVAVVGIVTAWLKIPSSRSHLEDAEGGALLSLLSTKRARTGLYFFGLSMFSIFLAFPFLATSLVMNGGIPEDQLYIAYAAGGFASIITTPRIGKLIDKIGVWSTYKWTAPIGAVLLSAMLVVNNIGIVAAALGLAVSMTLNGARGVASMTLINNIPPARFRAAYLSLKSTVQYASGGLATLVAGFLVSNSAAGNLIGLEWVGCLSIIFSFLSMPFAYQVAMSGAQPHPKELDQDTSKAS